MSVEQVLICDGCGQPIGGLHYHINSVGDYGTTVKIMLSGKCRATVSVVNLDFCGKCINPRSLFPLDDSLKGRDKIIAAIKDTIMPKYDRMHLSRVTAAMISTELLNLGVVQHEDKRSIGDCLGGHGLKLPWKKINGQRWYLFDAKLLDNTWNLFSDKKSELSVPYMPLQVTKGF